MKYWPILTGIIAAFFLMNRNDTVKKISKNGLEMIKNFEGFNAVAYVDQSGKWHIGYGHLIQSGEKFDSIITPGVAETLLLDDIKHAENTVNSLVKIPLSQSMYDALVSFVYNVGSGNFSSSTLLKLLNNGEKKSTVANEFDRWIYTNNGTIKVDGLVNRRKIEKNLFLA